MNECTVLERRYRVSLYSPFFPFALKKERHSSRRERTSASVSDVVMHDSGSLCTFSAARSLRLRCPHHKTHAWLARKGTGESLRPGQISSCMLVHHTLSCGRQTDRQQTKGIYPCPRSSSSSSSRPLSGSLQVCCTIFWGAPQRKQYTPP